MQRDRLFTERVQQRPLPRRISALPGAGPDAALEGALRQDGAQPTHEGIGRVGVRLEDRAIEGQNGIVARLSPPGEALVDGGYLCLRQVALHEGAGVPLQQEAHRGRQDVRRAPPKIDASCDVSVPARCKPEP
jgi:hypothetical protein